MRIPVFLLAGVAAFAAAAQSFYTEPAANQVTRLIGAVKEVGGLKGAISGETYDFPEDRDLAKAVADIVRVLGGSVTNSAAAAEEVE